MALSEPQEYDVDGTRLLLMLRGRNADMVRKWLGNGVTVLVPEGRLPAEFDLCILDASSLAAYVDELTARKKEAGDVFLPYLLVVQRGPGVYSRAQVRDLVDEVLTVPVEPAELGLRIQSLLRTRRQSQLLEERKERELRQLRRQNERLDQFAGIVSHDLRNPLTVAGGAVDLSLETGKLKHLDLAKGAIEQTHDLIESILELARNGKTVDEPEPTDLETVARTAWAYVPAKRGRLTVERTGTLDADPKRLQELFGNLFRNAMEHGAGEDGDVTIRVGPLCEAASERPRGFYVEDDGPGIPARDREKILRFGYTTDRDGTGFGLAIVKSIASAHGWRVVVTESEAGGARFEFRWE